MEKKQKHSIIWLIIIIIAILAIVFITIAGAKNNDTNTAYAAEMQETTYNDGIEEIITYSSSTQETNERNLYFTNTEYNGNTQLYVRAGIKYQNEENTTNNIEIGYITNQPYNIRIYISTTESSNEQIYLQDVKTNSNGLTKINIQIENLIVNTDYYIMFQFAGYNTPTPANTWWINILNLQVNDNTKNIVNYESYLYSYLNNQFQNAENNGYENGYNDGESIYRNNPFNGASLINAVITEPNHKITNTPITILSNGISFQNIANEADSWLYNQDYQGARGIEIEINVMPFVFEQNQIYVSMSNGFAVIQMYDQNGNSYYIEQGDELTQLGYPLTSTNAYGKTITKIYFAFANPDYVGKFLVGQTASQESAYNEGYNKGYNNGYDKGYNSGVIESNGVSWSISKLVSTVSASLSTDLIGNISIGDMLSVAIGILLTFAVIRFFGGG